MSCLSSEASQSRLVPWAVSECPSYFEKALKEQIRAPEPVLTSGFWQNCRTVEESSAHEYLHSNAAMTNSCYMDNIYHCKSFLVLCQS